MKARDCHHFARVPHAACRIRSKAGLAVYVYLCSAMNGDSQVWHSQARIAQDMGMPLRTVSRGLTDLASDGWIRKLPPRGRRLGNAYEVLAKADENFARAKSGTPESVPTKSGTPKVTKPHAKSGVSYMPKSVPIQEQGTRTGTRENAHATSLHPRLQATQAALDATTPSNYLWLIEQWNDTVAKTWPGLRAYEPAHIGAKSVALSAIVDAYGKDIVTAGLHRIVDEGWHGVSFAGLLKEFSGVRVIDALIAGDNLSWLSRDKDPPKGPRLPKLTDILDGKTPPILEGYVNDIGVVRSDRTMERYLELMEQHHGRVYAEWIEEAERALEQLKERGTAACDLTLYMHSDHSAFAVHGKPIELLCRRVVNGLGEVVT